MTYYRSARAAARRTRSAVLAVLTAVGVALAGGFVYQSLASTSSSAAPPAAPPAAPSTGPELAVPPPDEPGRPRAGITIADGAVPDGVTVFDEEFPAVSKLDPDLLRAVRQAASDAARDRVGIFVNSGWRSARYQEQLLREAVAEHGSAKEAARWVSSPETSAHVSGDAIDIGPAAATAWMSKHGAGYGLCQIYRNEPWHYELRPEAVDDGCPRMYADPTQDPRMRQR